MSSVVVPNPDAFIVRQPEIDTDQRSLAAQLQLPQPLVGDEEVGRYRHGKNTAWTKAPAPNTRNARTQDGLCIPLCCQVNENSHDHAQIAKSTRADIR